MAKKYPGVSPVKGKPGVMRIRAWAVDPKTGFPTEVQRHVRMAAPEAYAEKLRLEDEIRRGGPKERPTLRSFSRSWIESRKARGRRRTTLENGIMHLARHIFPTFGDFFVDAITHADVETWLVEQTKRMRTQGDRGPYRPSTINLWLATLQQIVGAYYRQAGGQSPIARVERLPVPGRAEDNPNSMSASDVGAVLVWIRDHRPRWYPALFIALVTGVRVGEVLALQWDDLDEPGGVIHIRRTLAKSRTLHPTKSGKPRTVPLTPDMAELLRAHRRELMARQDQGFGLGLMFPADDCRGTYRSKKGVAGVLRAAAEAVGIAHRLTPHATRRTFVNLLRQDGVDGIVRRAIVGHESAEVHDVYSTVGREEREAAVGNLIEAFRRKP